MALTGASVEMPPLEGGCPVRATSLGELAGQVRAGRSWEAGIGEGGHEDGCAGGMGI